MAATGRLRGGRRAGLALFTALATAASLVVPLVDTGLAQVPPPADIEVTCDHQEGQPGDENNCINPVDDPTEEFTARVTNEAGLPVPGATVLWSVASEKEMSLAPTSCETMVDGTCSVTLENENPQGGDSATVTGCVVPEGRDECPEPPLSDSADKRWEERAAASLALTPQDATNPVGEDHTVTATVTDQFGEPVEGETVLFKVAREGDPIASGQDVTDGQGKADFTYRNDTAGEDTITACVEGETTGQCDPNPDLSDEATKTWEAGAAESLALTPQDATNPVRDDHTVTATVTDEFGNPVAGETVLFEVESDGNPAPESGTDVTDAQGEATFTYTNDTNGKDTITACVAEEQEGQVLPVPPDPDEECVDEEEEPDLHDDATKTWEFDVGDIVVTCDHQEGQPGDENHCINPVEQETETFTALVTDADDDPISGVRVDWGVSGPDAGKITLNPTNCTTGADGTCSTTATNANPEAGDDITVTGTVAGTAESDSARKRWQARAPQLELAPQLATNETNTSHTVTATVTDQFGEPFANQTVEFSVSGRNTIAPQERTTNAAGEASFTYTDTGPTAVAGTDTITATHTGPATPTGSADTATKRWIPEAVVAASVVLDMEGPAPGSDGDCVPPIVKTSTNAVATVHGVCAEVRTAGTEPLIGHPVTFTSTGPGHFTNAAGTANFGTSRTVTTDANGRAFVFITSQQSGTQTVTATSDGVSDGGTKTWEPLAARNIALAPATATNEPGTTHEIIATTTDRFGNPVPGVDLAWTRSGAGVVVSPGETPTDAAGRARIVIRSDDEGTTTVTATITGPAAHTTECGRAAGDPAGAPAGNCTASASKTWETPPPPADHDDVRTIGLQRFRGPRLRPRRVIVRGRVRVAAPNADHAECFANVPVRVQRRFLRGAGSRRFRTLRTITSGGAGVYRTRLFRPRRAHRIRVVARPLQVGEHRCLRAVNSRRVRRR